jgi:polyphosphate kinase
MTDDYGTPGESTTAPAQGPVNGAIEPPQDQEASVAGDSETGPLVGEAVVTMSERKPAGGGDAVDGSQAELPDLRDPALYLNRELSLLAFQQRVLEEAQDPTNPLLERAKFLAILGSNLDEFFMVRVAGLRQQLDAGVSESPADGMTPAEQLAAIRKTALELMRDAQESLVELQAQMAEEGIRLLDFDDLNEKQQRHAARYFDEIIFPVLTPLAYDPGRPFPFISNLSLNLAVTVLDEEGERHFARIKVPGTLPLLVPIKRSSGGVRKDGTPPRHHFFVWTEQVIAAHLDRLFPGLTVEEAYPFRVTRDADNDIQELEASDLLEMIEVSVRQRRFGNVVRLSINPDMPDFMRQLLIDEMAVDANDVYVADGPLSMGGLWALHGIDRHDLKDPHFVPAMDPVFDVRGRPSLIFDAIRHEDLMLHHPYDSFLPVIKFLKAAATDPDVLAIKMTLYRVGRDSPVVDALLEARENGKQVAVLVELKARFDEESNIGWARKLEKQGVHVVYGLLGLKTHSKLALVVRKEGEGIRRYVHMATGNYNHATAHLYTDLGMFTADPELGAEVSDVFNYLTGYSRKREYPKLLVAPLNLRDRLSAMIRREVEKHQQGSQGHLVFKMNSLVDPAIIRELYRASAAGVRIDLIVRGICCLRPGVEGLSETIQVTSILGRFLEHSRIYYFRNGGQEEIYTGSADLMPRNIDRRVEVVFPVTEPELVERLRDEVLAVMLADTVKARRMLSDGSYVRVRPAEGEAAVSCQRWLIDRHHARTYAGRDEGGIIVDGMQD